MKRQARRPSSPTLEAEGVIKKVQVYLEAGADGRAMAHVLHLPGCTAAAETREAALTAVPIAIQGYLTWLGTHGEDADGETGEIEVVEESHGFGPFDPGDRAALFGPDREPLAREELERLFRLMGYSRRDLLALIAGVPDGLLCEEYTTGWSVERILRHIGGAEIWYVTRIDQDWHLPGYEEHRVRDTALDWLEWTRQSAMRRLGELYPHERSQVFCPSRYTDHPDELWTARKVFRRFLEHEREHTAQIEAILRAR